MYQTFWRNPALRPEPERESLKPKRLLSSQIHFTSVCLSMVVKSTKASTSQSFQRNFLITGEYKVKKQKNGNVHNYIYYHCTKKRKDFDCPEPCIRQEELDRQLSSEIQKVSLPKDWAEEL